MRRLVSCNVFYVREMCNSERGGEGTRGWVMLDAVDSSCSCYAAVRIVRVVRCRVLYVPACEAVYRLNGLKSKLGNIG